jgi:hypothetical protein
LYNFVIGFFALSLAKTNACAKVNLVRWGSAIFLSFSLLRNEGPTEFGAQELFPFEKEVSMVGTIRFNNLEEKLSHLQSLINIPSINPKSYSSDGEYYRLDFISHESFGLGFVEEVISEGEVKVFFSSGERILKQKSFISQRVV